MQTLTLRALAFYLRHTPISKGKYRLSRLSRLVLKRLGPTLATHCVPTRYGFSIELDLRDWIPQETGEFEPTTSAIAARVLKPGDNVVDVGATIGYFTLLFARYVGATGRVYAFEAVRSLARCRRSRTLCSLPARSSGTARSFAEPGAMRAKRTAR